MNRFQKAGAGFGFLLAILAGFEGLRLTGYLDIAGVPTYCYGKTGPEAIVGKTYPRALCDELLSEEGAKVWQAVDRHVEVPMTPWQWVAIASWTYNFGEGALRSSTMLRLINAGDWVAGCNELLKWNKAKGRDGVKRPVRGLTLRRQQERLICLGYAFDADFSPNHRPVMTRALMAR